MSEDQEPAAEAREDSGTSGVEGAVVPQSILELDEVYAALGHPRRRYLCYTLHEKTAWSLEELAAKIAAWETDVAVDEVTEPDRDQVYVDLYHAHVPKLVDLGVVEFDPDAETIVAAETAEQVLHALAGMGASLDSKQEAHAREEPDDEGF